MRNQTMSQAALIAMVLFLSLAGSADATCELIPTKNENFAGLELIRACSILPFLAIQPQGPDICASLPVVPPQEPLVDLVANDMLYFNWEIPAANVPVLESALGLPDRGFRLAPISIVRDESPKYYMSLNFYSTNIAGVVNYRTEWSIYVAKDGDPKPRYMVVQVQSSEDSADPTSPGFTNFATDVVYTLDNGQVQASSPDFEASFQVPANVVGTTQIDPAWAEANDALYWINGLADTALYNGGLTDATPLSIDPAAPNINNASVWSAFLAPQPTNVVLFQQPLEFAFTPYFNLTDPTLGLDPAYVGALQVFENFTFGAFSYGHAFLVLQGLAEPLVRFDVETDNVPSVFINFTVPRRNVRALESAIGLPPGFRLARHKMTPREPARYLLTLNIYETPDLLTGARVNRAEWSVYVKDENDPTADDRYFMVIDVDSNGASLNPVDLFTPPTALAYGIDPVDGKVRADIADKFSVEYAMPPAGAPSVRLHPEWILANDRVYWRNGVYDRLFYNGQLLDADVAAVPPASVVVDDRSPWAAFVDDAPPQVLVFRNPLRFVIRPWNNVEELCFGP